MLRQKKPIASPIKAMKPQIRKIIAIKSMLLAVAFKAEGCIEARRWRKVAIKRQKTSIKAHHSALYAKEIQRITMTITSAKAAIALDFILRII